jgi:hypothetical protein
MQTDFFDHLYEHCEGVIELRPLPSGRQQFFLLKRKEQMQKFYKQHPRENMYFGVATRNGAGGTKENIVNFPAVWADVDFKDIEHTKLHKKVKQFPFSPSAIVASGGGAHFYWLLKVPAEKNEAEKVEEVNRRIAQQLSGDMNSCDAARILRIPGTKNYKYTPPRPVKITRMDSFYYQLDDFLEILPVVKSNKSLSKNSNGNPQGWLLEALKGVAQHNPGRDKTGAKIAGYFIDKLSYREVLTILLAWNEHNSPPMDEKAVHRIVRSVYRYKKSSEAHDETPRKRVTLSFNRGKKGGHQVASFG